MELARVLRQRRAIVVAGRREQIPHFVRDDKMEKHDGKDNEREHASPRLCLPLLRAPRAPERVHPEVDEHQGKHRGDNHLARAAPSVNIAQVLADPSRSADNGQREEHESGDFQPENASDSPGVTHGDASGLIGGAHPAVLAGAASSDTQQSPAEAPGVTRVRWIFLALHGVMRYPYSSSGLAKLLS